MPEVRAGQGMRTARAWRGELPLAVIGATVLAFAILGDRRLAGYADSWLGALMFAWLFGVIILGSMSVVRHADGLAALLGEPYGTMILTLSVASIEIITIAIVMTTGDPNATLARDTMFSVVMIVLNGLVGLALLLGGIRYKEQEYNLQGVNAYLSVIVALSVFGLIVPNLTISTRGRNILPRTGNLPDRHVRRTLRGFPGDPDDAPPCVLRRPLAAGRGGRRRGRRA